MRNGIKAERTTVRACDVQPGGCFRYVDGNYYMKIDSGRVAGLVTGYCFAAADFVHPATPVALQFVLDEEGGRE